VGRLAAWAVQGGNVFTGLIEEVGTIVEASPRRGSTRLGISSALPKDQMTDGESVAVDGVCLTVVERRGNRFYADAVAETLQRTTLGKARPGDHVNLERALSLGDRLGGHLVLGHADGTVRLAKLTRRGDDVRLRLELPADLRRYVAYKGSVALHGVSLTVSGIEESWFEVALVPETLSRTTLGKARVGDTLNVEVDLLARYLERLTGEGKAGGAGIWRA
jgi:riboflavin synthase